MTVTKEYLRDLLSEETVPYELNPEWEVVTNVAVVAAAGFVERLLPATCENCHGKGQTHDDPDCYACTCQVCHGTGQLWDEGLVEVVAKALWMAEYPTSVDRWDQFNDAHPLRVRFTTLARAVLAALTAEVGK